MTHTDDAAETTEALLTGELRLSARHLQEIPRFALACCGIQVLDLSANSLTRLPVEISELKSLTDLDLGFNQLRDLPACIGGLTALTSLRASYNQIELLHPEALIGLGSGCLVDLQLGDNALRALPAEVGCLTRLTHLDLRYNRLSALPPELGRLSNTLQQLGLEGCPLGQDEGDAEGAGLRHARDGKTPEASTAPMTVITAPYVAHGPQSQQRRALYRQVMSAAADSLACAATGQGSIAALAGALQQLERSGDMGFTGSRVTTRPAEGPGHRWSGAGPNPGVKPQAGASPHMNSSPQAVSSESMVVHGGHGQGLAAKGPASASGRGFIPGFRPAQLAPLQLQETRTESDAHSGVQGGDLCQPLSPLTDLRNSFADVELAAYLGDGASEGEDHGCHDHGINLVGSGSAVDAAGSPGAAVSATAVEMFSEELSELPPAAAAAIYRSLDMVAAGMQEMRDGRPLSRGGTSGFAADVGIERPGTRSSHGAPVPRPASQQDRRRTPTAFAGGRPVTGTKTASTTAQGHPIHAVTSGSNHTGLVSVSRLAGLSGEGQELTGALALLASAGKTVGASRLHGPGRPQGGAMLAAAVGSGAHDGAYLGSLAPITFPLASGVRGMLRVVSGSGRQPPNQPIQADTMTSTAAGAGARQGDGNLAHGHDSHGAAKYGNALESDQAASDVDTDMDVVRRLLAEKNPELLRVLDEQVLNGDTGE